MAHREHPWKPILGSRCESNVTTWLCTGRISFFCELTTPYSTVGIVKTVDEVSAHHGECILLPSIEIHTTNAGTACTYSRRVHRAKTARREVFTPIRERLWTGSLAHCSFFLSPLTFFLGPHRSSLRSFCAPSPTMSQPIHLDLIIFPILLHIFSFRVFPHPPRISKWGS